MASNFNPHEREARDAIVAEQKARAEAILIHTSVKLVTWLKPLGISFAKILIHTSVKLVTGSDNGDAAWHRF